MREQRMPEEVPTPSAVPNRWPLAAVILLLCATGLSLVYGSPATTCTPDELRS